MITLYYSQFCPQSLLIKRLLSESNSKFEVIERGLLSPLLPKVSIYKELPLLITEHKSAIEDYRMIIRYIDQNLYSVLPEDPKTLNKVCEAIDYIDKHFAAFAPTSNILTSHSTWVKNHGDEMDELSWLGRTRYLLYSLPSYYRMLKAHYFKSADQINILKGESLKRADSHMLPLKFIESCEEASTPLK